MWHGSRWVWDTSGEKCTCFSALDLNHGLGDLEEICREACRYIWKRHIGQRQVERWSQEPLSRFALWRCTFHCRHAWYHTHTPFPVGPIKMCIRLAASTWGSVVLLWANSGWTTGNWIMGYFIRELLSFLLSQCTLTLLKHFYTMSLLYLCVHRWLDPFRECKGDPGSVPGHRCCTQPRNQLCLPKPSDYIMNRTVEGVLLEQKWFINGNHVS